MQPLNLQTLLRLVHKWGKRRQKKRWSFGNWTKIKAPPSTIPFDWKLKGDYNQVPLCISTQKFCDHLFTWICQSLTEKFFITQELRGASFVPYYIDSKPPITDQLQPLKTLHSSNLELTCSRTRGNTKQCSQSSRSTPDKDGRLSSPIKGDSSHTIKALGSQDA